MGFVTVTAPQAASAPAVNPPNVDKEPIVEVESRDMEHAAANDLEGVKRGRLRFGGSVNWIEISAWTRGGNGACPAAGNGSTDAPNLPHKRVPMWGASSVRPLDEPQVTWEFCDMRKIYLLHSKTEVYLTVVISITH